MIVLRCEISGELVEISLGNRVCDPQEFFPDGYTPPLGSAGRAPYPTRTGTGYISFPDSRHIAIIAKSNPWNKVARKGCGYRAGSESRDEKSLASQPAEAFGEGWWSQRDSNPCLRLERALS